MSCSRRPGQFQLELLARSLKYDSPRLDATDDKHHAVACFQFTPRNVDLAVDDRRAPRLSDNRARQHQTQFVGRHVVANWFHFGNRLGDHRRSRIDERISLGAWVGLRHRRTHLRVGFDGLGQLAPMEFRRRGHGRACCTRRRYVCGGNGRRCDHWRCRRGRGLGRVFRSADPLTQQRRPEIDRHQQKQPQQAGLLGIGSRFPAQLFQEGMAHLSSRPAPKDGKKPPEPAPLVSVVLAFSLIRIFGIIDKSRQSQLAPHRTPIFRIGLQLQIVEPNRLPATFQGS